MSRRADAVILSGAGIPFGNSDPLADLLILVFRVTLTRHRRLDEFRLCRSGINPLPLRKAAFVRKT